MIQRYLTHLEKRNDFVENLRDAFAATDPAQRNREIKALIQKQHEKIRRLNRGGASGADTVRFLSEMVDTLLRVLWDQVEMGVPDSANLVALVAVGGYGRMELCPQSDIDLLVLTSAKPDAHEIIQAETMVRSLWDFGFTAGSSVRSVAQCQEASAKDSETWTSFLNERFVAGNHALYQRFVRMMGKRLFRWRVSTLVAAKLSERQARLGKTGNLIQLLEPNIKEGLGCLRDVHTMMWVARVKHDCATFGDLVRAGLITPQEQEDLQAAYDFLLQVRCSLHFLTQKKDDRLSFYLQPEVAAELGFADDGSFKAVEIFLKVFYHHTKTVFRVTETVISRWMRVPGKAPKFEELRRHPHFQAEDGALDLTTRVGNPFRGRLDLILEYFDLVNRLNLDFAHHAILRIKQAVTLFAVQEDLALAPHLARFLALCQKPERVGRMLRCMNDVGLIRLLIPDFNLIYCHSQHDIYHIYTTDEHTITVVRQLAYLSQRIEPELVSLKQALEQVSDRELLVLACFYHDIGKGLGAGHSASGARLVFQFLERIGYSPSRCLTASNLVLHHLLMNEVIQRRDLDDPKTIHDFTNKIDSPAFLHKLYVMTYCDVSSVHPDAWSTWKASLLQQLYERSLHLLLQPYQAAQARRGPETSEVLAAVSRILPPEAAKTHLQELTENYLAAHSAEEIALHASLLQRAAEGGFGVYVLPKSTHWEITVAAQDEKALLCRIAGCVTHLGLSILSAKIYTLGGGKVVDRFWVGLPEEASQTAEELRGRLLSELQTRFRLGREELQALRLRRVRTEMLPEGDAPVAANVLVSNEISDAFSVVDVTCRDQIGLLFQVALVLSDLGLNVHGAVLTTEADKAMDSFYITTAEGAKVIDASRAQAITDALTRELAFH